MKKQPDKSLAEAEFKAHHEKCAQCCKTKRVNDFCDVGRMLFFAWNPTPESATVLSEEESEKIIAKELGRQRKSAMN